MFVLWCCRSIVVCVSVTLQFQLLVSCDDLNRESLLMFEGLRINS